MASSDGTFDELEYILMQWFNTLNIWQPIKSLKDFEDGSIFLQIAEVIKNSNQVTPKFEDQSNENSSNAVIVGKRYAFIKSVLNDYLKLDSDRIFNFEALVNGDNDEITKVAILFLTAVVQLHIIHQLNRHTLRPLTHLVLNIQAFIQDCLEMMLTVENEAQLHSALSTVLKKRRVIHGKPPLSWTSSIRVSRKRNSKESQIPDSPLQEFIESADFKYKMALKEKKKEINYLKICLNEKSEKISNLSTKNEQLQAIVSENEKQIGDLNEKVNYLMPYRELVEMNEPDQLDLKEKIAVIEEKYKQLPKECLMCPEHMQKIGILFEEKEKLLQEKENLEQNLEGLKQKITELEKSLEDKTTKLSNLQIVKEEGSGQFAHYIQQVEKYRFTSNLYQDKYEALIKTIEATPKPAVGLSEVQVKKEDSKEDVKPKIEKKDDEEKEDSKEEVKPKVQSRRSYPTRIQDLTGVSAKSFPDKNVTKIKELQSTISNLNKEKKQFKKNETNLRKELDHLTSLYGSNVSKVEKLETDIEMWKAKALEKEISEENLQKIEPPQKRTRKNRRFSDSHKPEETIKYELPLLKKNIEDKSQQITEIQEKLTIAQKENEDLKNQNNDIITRQQSEIANLKLIEVQLSLELGTLKQSYQKLLLEKEMSEKDVEVKTVILKENYDQMRQEKEECDVKIQQLEENRNAFLNELEQLHQKLVEVQNVKEQALEQIQSLEQEIESYKLTTNELTERNSTLTNQFQELSKCMKEKEKDYNKQINELENSNNKLLSELEQTHLKLSEKDNHSQEVIVRLKESNEKLNKELKDNKEKSILLNAKLSASETEKQEVASEVERLTATFNKAEVEKHSLMLEIKQTKEKLSALESVKEKSLTEIEQTAAKLSLLENERNEYLEKTKQLNTKLDEMSSNKKKLSAEKGQLSSQLEQHQNEKAKLLKQVESMNPKLNQLENDKSQLLTELEHLRENYRMVIDENRKLGEMIQEKKLEVAQFALNITKLQKELQTSKKNSDSSEKKYSECRKELEYTGEQLSELRKARDRQNRDIIKLEASKESEISELKGEKRRLLKMYDDLCKSSTADNEKKSNEIQMLRIELEKKIESYNHLRQLDSIKSDEIDVYVEEKKELLRKCQDLEKGLKLQRELSDSEIKKLSDELKEKEKLFRDKVDQLEAKEEEMLKVLNENNEIVKKIEFLQIESEKKENDMQELRIQIEQQGKDDVEKIKTSYEIELNKHLTEKDSIAQSFNALKAAFENKEKETVDIRNQFKKQNKDFEVKIKESKVLADEVRQLTHEIKKSQEHNESLMKRYKEKRAEVEKIKGLLKEMKSNLQEWKTRAEENSVAKEQFDRLLKIEQKFKEVCDTKNRFHAKIEELLNHIKLLESEKENLAGKLSQENKCALRRIEILKESNKKKSKRIEDLLREIDEQRQILINNSQNMKETLEKEVMYLKEKNRDLKAESENKQALKCDIEFKYRKIQSLSEELKKVRKISEGTKTLVHKNALYKLTTARILKRSERWKKIVTTLRMENRVLLNKLIKMENSPDGRVIESYKLSKMLELDAEVKVADETVRSLKFHVEKLENLLDLEENKNKRLFMRLKATEYKLFKLKREQEASCVLSHKKSKTSLPRIIYREKCKHKTSDDEELSEGPNDPDMPGHQYFILRVLKNYFDEPHSTGLKRKLPNYEDQENDDVPSSQDEEYVKTFFSSPSTITHKLGMNVINFSQNCVFRQAYAVENLPSSTHKFSDKALEFGFAIKKKKHSNSKPLVPLTKPANKLVSHPKLRSLYSHKKFKRKSQILLKPSFSSLL